MNDKTKIKCELLLIFGYVLKIVCVIYITYVIASFVIKIKEKGLKTYIDRIWNGPSIQKIER